MCELPCLCPVFAVVKLTAHEIGLVHLVLLPMREAFIALADLFGDPVFELRMTCEVPLNVHLRCQLHLIFFWGGSEVGLGVCVWRVGGGLGVWGF